MALTPTPEYFTFTFDKTGWHQMVVNATWERPSVVCADPAIPPSASPADSDPTGQTGSDPLSNCSTPILKVFFLYASAAFSVRPQPTNAGTITAPTSAFTLWSHVLERTPGPLPIDKQASGKQKVCVRAEDVE